MPQPIDQATCSDRNRTAGVRGRAERLLILAEHLPVEDRLLLEHALEGKPLAHLARLMGKDPQSLRRRVRRLVTHLEDPVFGFVVACAELIPSRARRTAQIVMFKRQSLRGAAAVTGQTLYRVRRQMDLVRAMAHADDA